MTLCKLVRAGHTLTAEQRHHLAELLDIIGSAVRVTKIYPAMPDVMEPVSTAYAELLASSGIG